MERLPKMTGKVVAVTGCTSGTGKIFAQAQDA
jgi:NAD(P)-dependent dehydrogenase (short-subunit alcohol dehydrogenase family)